MVGRTHKKWVIAATAGVNRERLTAVRVLVRIAVNPVWIAGSNTFDALWGIPALGSHMVTGTSLVTDAAMVAGKQVLFTAVGPVSVAVPPPKQASG